MKKNILFTFCLILNLWYLSAQKKNDLLPQNNNLRLVYNTSRAFYIDTSFYNHQVKHIPEVHYCKRIVENHKTWQGDLYNEAIMGDFFPYEYEAEKFNIDDYFVKDTLIAIDDQSQKEVYYISENEPNYDRISDLEFIEDWYFDADNFRFEKEIIGIIPILHIFDIDNMAGEERYKGKKRFLYLQNSMKALKEPELLYNLEYEFSISNDLIMKYNSENPESLAELNEWVNIRTIEKESSPFWNSYTQKKLMITLLNKIMDKSVKAYDYYTKELIQSDEDIFKALGGYKEEVMIVDPETGETISKELTYEPEYTDFQSVIFKEELYWDETNHCFEKKVISISPVLKQTYMNPETGEDIFEKYKVACEVFLNQ